MVRQKYFVDAKNARMRNITLQKLIIYYLNAAMHSLVKILQIKSLITWKLWRATILLWFFLWKLAISKSYDIMQRSVANIR